LNTICPKNFETIVNPLYDYQVSTFDNFTINKMSNVET
jgi:hypothetical protein